MPTLVTGTFAVMTLPSKAIAADEGSHDVSAPQVVKVRTTESTPAGVAALFVAVQ